MVVLFGAAADYTNDRLKEARARQVWALVAVGAGDPVQLSTWSSWASCEAVRERTAREAFQRHGTAPGLRCKGVKSWLELRKETENR